MTAFLRGVRPGARSLSLRSFLLGSPGARRGAWFLALSALACGSRTELPSGQEPCGSADEKRACADACGQGEQRCEDGVWQKCEVSPVSQQCQNACGTGSQTCREGAWGACELSPISVECSDPCGVGARTCAGGVWGSCQVMDRVEECQTVCGKGQRICSGGVQKSCNAPQPKPPKLVGTVRDFSDRTTEVVQKHPDFELPLTGNIDEKNLVESTLGPDDKPVYAFRPNSRTTSGQANFDQWYRDTPGINLSAPLELQLERSSAEPGLFVYSNDLFFPIDGKLLGNAGHSHNFHFTLESSFKFHYIGREVFRFEGDDDMWVFINRQLVIDLGGIHSSESSRVELDQIAGKVGMVKGQVYPLHLFFAERHTNQSHFMVETSIADPGSCE